MLSFWRKLVQWKLGAAFNLVTDEIGDPWDDDGDRRAFTICQGDSVVMMTFISPTWDDETEDVLGESATEYLGLTPGAKIYVLCCKGVKCQLKSVQTDGVEYAVYREAGVVAAESEQSIETIREWLQHGIAHGMVPPAT